MTLTNWDNITNYLESVGTSDKTFPFAKPQELVKVTNKGNADLIYTIGTQTGTLTPRQSVTVNETISSLTLRSTSGFQGFEVWAIEKGTEKEETGPLDLNSINAQLVDMVTNVKSFGAKGDGVTDDTVAIKNAIASNKNLFFPAGTYILSDKLTLPLNLNGIKWEGVGSNKTILQFNSSTISACIERITGQSLDLHFEGFKVSGLGKNVGTNIHGICSEYAGGGSASYNLKMVDVGVENVSGDGFHILDWYQTYYLGCYARHIKGNGFVIDGDQYPTMIDTGQFNLDIDGWSWWFKSGKPFLQNLNCGDVANGLRIGRPASDPQGTAYCRPAIYGCNIEHCRAGGTGLRFENGSSFSVLTGVNVYSNSVSGVVTYGVYMDYLNNSCLLLDNVTFNSSGTGAGFTNKFFVNGTSAAASLIALGASTSADFNSGGSFVLVNLKAKNGGLSTDSIIDASNGIFNEGVNKIASKTITASQGIYRDSGSQNDFVWFVDATTAPVTVTIDYPSYIPNRNIIIKKIDSTANAVTITANGGNLDGQPSYVLSAQNKYVNVLNNGSKWYIIGQN